MKMGKKTTADLPIKIMGGMRSTRMLTVSQMLKVIGAYDDDYVRVTLEKIDDDDEDRDIGYGHKPSSTKANTQLSNDEYEPPE